MSPRFGASPRFISEVHNVCSVGMTFHGKFEMLSSFD